MDAALAVVVALVVVVGAMVTHPTRRVRGRCEQPAISMEPSLTVLSK